MKGRFIQILILHLCKTGVKKETYNFIGGIGGRDITKEDIHEMFENLRLASVGEQIDTVSYYNVRCAL